MSIQYREKGEDFLINELCATTGRGNRTYNNMRVPMPNPVLLSEPSVDISMRASDYDRLLEVLADWDDGSAKKQYYLALSSRLAYERVLRNTHPALKNAYEKYEIMLDLLANGREMKD